MKKFAIPAFMAFTLLMTAVSKAQDAEETGLPGDNFSLEGALELFKASASPEDFEKKLNAEGNDVNNLDLNADGEVDYIKVIDKKDGDVHVFILQAAVSETENQDVAVIELEKTGESNAVIQIVGDEEIFGEATIVEPSDTEKESAALFFNNHFTHGPAAGVEERTGIIVNVWFWPSVRFVYAPAYVVWTSPWAWRARPIWWRPWHPLRYNVFYPRRIAYRPRYVVVHTHRIVRAHRIYRPVRVTSVTVRKRYEPAHAKYKVTRSSRSVEGRRVEAKRTRTTVEGPRGNKVTRTKTTVRRKKH